MLRNERKLYLPFIDFKCLANETGNSLYSEGVNVDEYEDLYR